MERLLLEPLPAADMGRMAAVSKYWRGVATSEPLWCALLRRDYCEHRPEGYARYRELSPRLLRDQSSDYDVLLRLVLVGGAGTGKSRFVKAVQGDAVSLGVRHGGAAVRLQLWARYGDLGFCAVSPACYRFADGLLAIYDQSNRASFESLARWHEETQHEHQGAHLVLCANKCDLPAAVTADEGRAMAASMEANWVRMSSKTGEGVDRAVALLVNRCLAERERHPHGRAGVGARRHAPERCGVQ